MSAKDEFRHIYTQEKGWHHPETLDRGVDPLEFSVTPDGQFVSHQMVLWDPDAPRHVMDPKSLDYGKAAFTSRREAFELADKKGWTYDDR